jgi:predicted phosphate transport protein (TIGR00153 family)
MGLLGRLLSLWVGPEREALDLVARHATLCREAVSSLKACIKSLRTGRGLKKAIGKVVEYEEAADQVRRRIVEKLAKGALPPLSREDFIRLVERLDLTADGAKDIARCFEILPTKRLSKEFEQSFESLIGVAIECSRELCKAIQSMGTDFRKSLALTKRVEELEKEADARQLDCLFELGKCKRVDFASLLLWERVIGYAEFITDACEDASDVLECIGARTMRS